MADSTIGITEPGSPNKLLDSESLTVGANTVERERVQITGTAATDIAPVDATDGLTVNVSDRALRDLGQVDIATALPAGANTIGGVNVVGGTISVTNVVSIDDNGATISVDDGAGSLTVDGTVAVSGGTISVTNVVSVDDNGTTISIDDGAGSITVDGTVTADAGTGPWPVTDNGGSLTVDGAVAVSGGTISVTNTPNVVVTTFPDNEPFDVAQYGGVAVGAGNAIHVQPGSGAVFSVDDNAGSLTVDGTVAVSGGTVSVTNTVTIDEGANALEVVGDVAHDAAAAGNPVLIAGIAQAMDDTSPPNQVTAESDATRLATDRDGAIFAHPHGARIWHTANNYTTQQTDASVKVAPSGERLFVTDIYLACGGSMEVRLEDGATTLLWGYMAAGRGDGAAVNFTTPLVVSAGGTLTATTSGAIEVYLTVNGYTSP